MSTRFAKTSVMHRKLKQIQTRNPIKNRQQQQQEQGQEQEQEEEEQQLNNNLDDDNKHIDEDNKHYNNSTQAAVSTLTATARKTTRKPLQE